MRNAQNMGGYTMKKRTEKNSPELIKRLLENSLPLSISRWFTGMGKKKK